MTAASATLTSATAAFTAADVGGTAIVVGAGAAGATLETTIAAFIDATQVTLTVAASTTVSGKVARIGPGYEISLPAVQDTYGGSSMAAIISLFDGDNKVLDFRQLREVIVIPGILTQQAATDAGFTNPVQMRDELRRIRAATAHGNNPGTAKSWLQETGSLAGSSNWGTTTLPAAERDSGTTRQAATLRLIWDQYWNPATLAYANLFLYGTVSDVSFAGRPGATTQTRIPFSVTFLVGSIKVG